MANIKNNDHPLVIVKTSEIHGFGCYARHPIKKGKNIIEYIGLRITGKEAEKELEKQNAFIFFLNERFQINGKVDKNIARFINHSCDPNCKYDIQDERIWICAVRDIKEGEELTYNYGYDMEDFENHTCKCGATNCVGYMVSEFDFAKIKAMKEMAKKASELRKNAGDRKI